jgi:hypothetical protein
MQESKQCMKMQSNVLEVGPRLMRHVAQVCVAPGCRQALQEQMRPTGMSAGHAFGRQARR